MNSGVWLVRCLGRGVFLSPVSRVSGEGGEIDHPSHVVSFHPVDLTCAGGVREQGATSFTKVRLDASNEISYLSSIRGASAKEFTRTSNQRKKGTDGKVASGEERYMAACDGVGSSSKGGKTAQCQ